jgi:sugar lactone lactonase YvrE
MKRWLPLLFCFLLFANAASASPMFLSTWGVTGTGPGQFNQPFGLDFDSQGNLYVADQANFRVQVFAPDGTYLRQWLTGGNTFPTGLRIANDLVYVVMNHVHYVNVYTTSGVLVNQIGALNGLFFYPTAISIAPSGNLYVVDSENERVVELAPDGTPIGAFGGYGSAPGQFNTPYGIAIDPAGNVYVSDRGNYRVEVFTDAGSFLRQWGTYGSGAGQFVGLDGMDFDQSGLLWVVDAGANSRMEQFTPLGPFVDSFGSFGSAPGQFKYHADVAVAPNGNIYVSDWGNNRIQVFGNLATASRTETWGALKARYH